MVQIRKIASGSSLQTTFSLHLSAIWPVHGRKAHGYAQLPMNHPWRKPTVNRNNPNSNPNNPLKVVIARSSQTPFLLPVLPDLPLNTTDSRPFLNLHFDILILVLVLVLHPLVTLDIVHQDPDQPLLLLPALPVQI
jgi:hypothetical protein